MYESRRYLVSDYINLLVFMSNVWYKPASMHKTSQNHTKEYFLTVKDVADMLQISVLTVYKYIRDETLEAIELGGHYRINQTSLDTFINKRRVRRKPTLAVIKESE